MTIGTKGTRVIPRQARAIPSKANGYPPGRVPQVSLRLSPGTGRSRALDAILRVPLLGKLLGANFVLIVGAFAAHELFPSAGSTLQIAVPLTLSFTVTAGLVWLALRPIAHLEQVAERVAKGDFSARVNPSSVADRDLLRLSNTINRLLDRVDADRARIQYLAGRSVRARDIERESVARELRDSFAQMVAAIALQLGAAQRVNRDPEVEQQLERSRSLIVQLTDAMRGVAETLYPGTLSEFGLPNALRALARRTEQHATVKVDLITEGFNAVQMTTTSASALYRAADEALRNVAQHADARHARIVLRSDEREVTLEIEDDGRGVDMRSRDPLQAGLGLFSAKAVLALVGGGLQISSAPSLGTHVVAHVPFILPRL